MKCNICPITQNSAAMTDIASQITEDGLFPHLGEGPSSVSLKLFILNL